MKPKAVPVIQWLSLRPFSWSLHAVEEWSAQCGLWEGVCESEAWNAAAHPGDWEVGGGVAFRAEVDLRWLGWSFTVPSPQKANQGIHTVLKGTQILGNLLLCVTLENSWFVFICSVFSCLIRSWHLVFRFCLIFMFFVSLCRVGTLVSSSWARCVKGQIGIFHDSGESALQAPFLLGRCLSY